MRLRLTHAADDLNPVEAGQVLVREHATELLALDERQGLFGVARQARREALLAENALEDIEDDGLVVDHQHGGEGRSRRHCPNPRGGFL